MAITLSSATHHSRPVPSAKSLVDVDGHGGVKLPHHRQREIPVVAIAVVEREAGEAPRKIAIDQPLMHLVHGDDVDVVRPKMRQHHAQEFRRDLEVMIGLEFGIAARPDVVQHENGADAREQRPHQMMRAGEIQRFQASADDVVAKLLHSGAGRLGREFEASG